MKKYHKLKIEAYYAGEFGPVGYTFYRANTSKHKFKWTQKSTQDLEKMNKKFKLIKRNDNLIIFEDNEFNGWKDVAWDKCGMSGHVLTEDYVQSLEKTYHNHESLIANAILSNKSPK